MSPVSECFYIGRSSAISCMVWADSLKLGMKQIEDEGYWYYNAVGFDDRSEGNTGTYFVKVLSKKASSGGYLSKLSLGYSYNTALDIEGADLVIGNIYRVDFVKENNVYYFYVYSSDGTLLGSASAISGSGPHYIAKVIERSL